MPRPCCEPSLSLIYCSESPLHPRCLPALLLPGLQRGHRGGGGGEGTSRVCQNCGTLSPRAGEWAWGCWGPGMVLQVRMFAPSPRGTALLRAPCRWELASFLPLPLCLGLGHSVSNKIKHPACPSCTVLIAGWGLWGMQDPSTTHRVALPFICLVPHAGTDPPEARHCAPTSRARGGTCSPQPPLLQGQNRG